MKILAIIEKGKDGLYSSYSEAHIGNSYFGGFGDSVTEVKEDFVASVKEAIAEQVAEGPSFFNFFDYINMSKFAEYAGINESKMRAYKSGSAYPGEKTLAKIVVAVKSIGAELCNATL